MTDAQSEVKPEEAPPKEERDKVIISVAKRHAVLRDIAQQLEGHQLQIVAEIAGHSYTLTTLNSEEEWWADSVMQTNNPKVLVASFIIARIAASIKAIDGIPISELFDYPDNMDVEVKALHQLTKSAKRQWELDQMLAWLGEQPKSLISDIGEEYKKLSTRADDSWTELKNS